MNRVDKIFYAIGWGLFALLAAASLLQRNGVFTLTDIGMKCSFRHVTGLFCPGCGGTHAIMALAAGHLADSFLQHPLVPYTAACFAIFLVWNSAALLLRPIPYVHFHIRYVYVGIGIIFLQWFIKNILLFL